MSSCFFMVENPKNNNFLFDNKNSLVLVMHQFKKKERFFFNLWHTVFVKNVFSHTRTHARAWALRAGAQPTKERAQKSIKLSSDWQWAFSRCKMLIFGFFLTTIDGSRFGVFVSRSELWAQADVWNFPIDRLPLVVKAGRLQDNTGCPNTHS